LIVVYYERAVLHYGLLGLEGQVDHGCFLWLVQEFKLESSVRNIQPEKTTMVNLTFKPKQAIMQDSSLIIDNDQVSKNMASITIKAECIVPNVKIEPSNSLE
jgi:hypothetical protein